ncbi:hypothetical protein AAKU55_003650 [Oxalobacteraceae bacterium GrIS 1.11]
MAVHLDGDSVGAQQVAARYRLRSYPTLILFRPDGREITRLPCEADGDTGVGLLQLALAATYTARESFDAALSGTRALDADEWRLLSFYSWDTDEGQVLGQRELADSLAHLARLCPPGAAALRLDLHALAAGAGELPDIAPRLLGEMRANMDILCNNGVKLIARAPPSARAALAQALDGTARAWADDSTLSAPDRMAALRLQVRLARFGAPQAGLAQGLRRRVSDLLQDGGGDPHARHALLNTAAGALSEAGLVDAADALLEAALPASHAPFYFMHLLAANAGRRGDTGAALDWYERAWHCAQGPATRLQWGASYLVSLIELAPQDAARLELAAAGILRDVQATPDAFYQRNGSQMLRIADKLNGTGPHCRALLLALNSGLAG